MTTHILKPETSRLRQPQHKRNAQKWQPGFSFPVWARTGPMQIVARQSVAQTHSIPQLRFARRMRTVETPPVEEGSPRNFLVEQPNHNVSELQFEKCLTSSTFLYWKTNFQTEARSVASHRSEAMPWKQEFEMANSVDDLTTSPSIFGHQYPNFEALDAVISSALKEMIQNSNSKKKVHLEDQKAQKRRPNSPWQAHSVCDLRILPGDRHSQDSS